MLSPEVCLLNRAEELQSSPQGRIYYANNKYFALLKHTSVQPPPQVLCSSSAALTQPHQWERGKEMGMAISPSAEAWVPSGWGSGVCNTSHLHVIRLKASHTGGRANGTGFNCFALLGGGIVLLLATVQRH